MSIRFYSRRAAYAELSNFYPIVFDLDGKSWPTVEHYFQAQKFPGTDYAEQIRNAASPMMAKRLGRSRAHPLRRDWENVKIDVMRAAVAAKFSDPELREVLLSTDDNTLIEASPGDSFWGEGKTRTGKNWLGRILMELRSDLRR